VRPLIAVIGRRAASVPILRYSATLAAEAICEAVFAGGGEPVVFHGRDAEAGDVSVGGRLARFDAVLMPGGADLGPEHYGQPRHPKTVLVVPFQDTLDLAVTRAVLRSGQPMLAICRGMQVLNVACGGSLVQHHDESTVVHRDAIHEVAVSPGSRMHAVVGAERIAVSSYHHQVLDRLGEGLTVTGVADDGVVEVVEHRDADVIAVQWHPEDLHATSAPDHALFADLVARADAHRSAR
jgi:putative glutamine amidotransferase